jgi:hypothetical protein
LTAAGPSAAVPPEGGGCRAASVTASKPLPAWPG